MDELSRILIFGILAMSTLAVAIVIFFVIYQRRLLAQQDQIRATESRYQKELLNASIQTQEVERQRIAKDLHDSVGSTLSAAKLFVYRLDNRQEDGEFAQLKTETAKMLDDTIANIRNTTRNLLPVNLERFGLVAALEDLFRQAEQLGAVKISFRYNKERRFAPEKEVAVFRIAQELLNNTLKHANAGQVAVEASFAGNGLALEYQDDGIGFDPGAYSSEQGIGLKSIKSRVEYLLASCVLETAKGKGVRVRLDCPDIDI